MERLLHYVWQHRLYPYGSLKTVEGVEVEVITPGLHNDNAGPDFIDAKLKLNGELWVGNVEVHTRSSDWYHHHLNLYTLIAYFPQKVAQIFYQFYSVVSPLVPPS